MEYIRFNLKTIRFNQKTQSIPLSLILQRQNKFKIKSLKKEKLKQERGNVNGFQSKNCGINHIKEGGDP